MLETKLPRSLPHVHNVSAKAIHQFIEAIRIHEIEIHSFMLVKNGHVLAETTWEPYHSEDPHIMNSLSKSFTSTAIGMAIAEGKLSLDDAVISFFSEKVTSEIAENMSDLKVRHLLTMTTGHREAPILPTRPSDDWIKEFLETPIEYEPGTHFVYNTAATYMLSAILTKVTDTKLLDYLQPRLFEPLGMTNISTTTCPRGIHYGGAGMRVKIEDVAKFGQLYLQKGKWEGKQIIPENWVEEATKKQVSNGNDPSSDWSQGYGYQFWRCRHGAYRGDGAFGQYCIVFPEHQTVIAITAGVMDMGDILEQVWTYLEPAIKNQEERMESAFEQDGLKQTLSSLVYEPPKVRKFSPDQEKWSNRLYIAERNHAEIRSFSFRFSNEKSIFFIESSEGQQQIQIGMHEWQTSECKIMGETLKVAVSGTWLKRNQFLMTVRLLGTPFVDTWTCDFNHGGARLNNIRNIWTVKGLSDLALITHLVGYVREND